MRDQISEWDACKDATIHFLLSPSKTMISLRLALTVAVAFAIFCAQGQSQEKDSEYLSDLTQLVDQEIDVRLKDGTLLAFGTVTTADAGKKEGSVKNLKIRFRGSKRIKSFPISKVIELYQNDIPLDVEYDRKDRCLFVSIEKRIDRREYRKTVERQLAGTRGKFWKPLTDDQHKVFMEKHHAFIAKTKKAMSNKNFHLVETEFFLFLSDLPPNDIRSYVTYLDAMYRELCVAFGLSPLKNIWCGKCVIVAFAQERDFLRFEASVMKKNDAAGAQGLCHQYSDGTVIFAGFQGDNGFFGHTMVHETTHGFVFRYMTSVMPPSWLNEGMSDWMANVIVKGAKIPMRQKRSAQTVIQQGSWGNFLTTNQIDGELYGAASTMVEILLSRNQDGNFKRFFDLIKEGKPADEALKEAYGISYQELQILYLRAAQHLAR